MATDHLVIPGIVQGGIVLPQCETALPDGAHVDIVIGTPEVSPALAAEFQAWEAASDEAWNLITEWESEEP